MKVSIMTLGCRVNQAESSVIKGSLEHNCVNIVNLNDNPDVCIINTCSVTAKSDYSSRQLIRKAVSTGARVIVTGCYAHLNESEIRSIPGVSEIVGNSRKFTIVSMLTGNNDLVFSRFSRSRPSLKVQDGCNFRCSYCSVPLARGQSKSIPLNQALERVQEIEAAGYKEVVLTGIHLGCYGVDLREKASLKLLIGTLLKFSKIERIRLSSLEINEIDDELLELLKERRLCSHLHIPLQSGSDKILQLMKRKYSSSGFAVKLSKIFSAIDNIAVGADVIVGFPGEDDKDFSDTRNLLDSFPFSYFHVFPFSARPGTEASSMRKKVRSQTIKERLAMLLALEKKKSCNYIQSQKDRVVDVLIEEKDIGGLAAGTSGNYLKVAVQASGVRTRNILLAKVVGISDNQVVATIIP